MPQSDDGDEFALLEIDIMQLINLFGSPPHKDDFAISRSLFFSNRDDTYPKRLNDEELYRIPKKKRNEVFLISAYKAILSRAPSDKEMKRHLDAMKDSDKAYAEIIDFLNDTRDSLVDAHNKERHDLAKATAADIDRWSRMTNFAWRK